MPMPPIWQRLWSSFWRPSRAHRVIPAFPVHQAPGYRMIALLLTCSLFFFWFLLGRSVLLLIPGQSGLGRELLAPAVGLAAILLPLFWLSRVGLPVGSFGGALFGIALLAGAAVHWHRRAAGIPREYGPFAGILGMALLAVGWPMLFHGLDWLSYGNNDMTNYSLLAYRFLGHGFFDVPDAAEILGGRHYSQTFWLQGLLERPGSELLLAGVAAVTGLHPTQAFMPLIVSAHLALIGALGALMAGRGSGSLGAARLGMAGLAVAPMLSFGALYQLLGQTLGLTLLIGVFGATALLGADGTRRPSLRDAALVAVLLAALLILYPEVLPFYLAGSAALGMLHLFRRQTRRPHLGAWLRAFGVVVALVPLFLQNYLRGAAMFLQHQVQSGVSGARQAADVFQQYLLPSGVAGLWGLLNIYAPPPEPFLSIAIAAGAVLLLGTAVFSLGRLSRADPVAVMFVAMLGAIGLLRLKGSAFGLYKMAMYFQPFLWGMLARLAAPLLERWRWTALPLLALGLVMAHTQWNYARLSEGDIAGESGAFNEIHDASRTRLLSELQGIRRMAGDRSLVSDTSNLVVAKLQAALLEGIRVGFPFFDIYPGKLQNLQIPQRPALEAVEETLRRAVSGRTRPGRFALGGTDEASGKNAFPIMPGTQPEAGQEDRYALLASTALQSPFNRRRFPKATHNFELLPWKAVHDHLIFVDSEQGKLYYSHERDRIALYQLEGDYFYPGRTMAGIGRHLLFQAVNPSGQPRLVLTLTASLKADGNNILPPAEAIGQHRVPLPIRGRGSARVISHPLLPQKIHDRSYIHLDLRQEGTRWKEERIGLMRLYGTGVQGDPRRITAFLRDISLLSETEYRHLKAPDRIESFPDDLANPNLEYSGIYEDGWVSEDSFVVLEPAAGAAMLEVEGFVPDLGDLRWSSKARLSIDGVEQLVRELRTGFFRLETPSSGGPGRHKIELVFSAVQALPGGDRRPVAAKLTRLGFRNLAAP